MLWTAPLTKKQLHSLARTKRGKCLATGSVKAKSKIHWECEQGHYWLATPCNVKTGHWCPECAGCKKHTIEDAQQMAYRKEGECLSRIYRNNKQKLRWKCHKGHTWSASLHKISMGQWCPRCVGKNRSMEDLQQLATPKNGKCLSPKYLGMHVKHRWQCSDGHRWEATPSSIEHLNTWCPICAQICYRRQDICRQILQTIFRKPFPQCRPRWLRNSAGNRMELDCYNEDLKIALEHNGDYHYHKHKYHGKSFRKVQQNDKEKALICKNRGIKLISIPYWIPLISLPEVITKALKRKGIASPANVRLPDIKELGTTSLIKKMQLLAKKKGGKFLQDTYLNARTPHKWQCRKGHIFMARPDNVKSGKWCPTCSGCKKFSIDDVKAWAKRNGWQCLSGAYYHRHHQLLWKCNAGHARETSFMNIRRVSSCLTCRALSGGTAQ